jgi:hypothetical protein
MPRPIGRHHKAVLSVACPGQSVYVFKPSDSSSLSVSVMEAPDSPPLSMGQAAAQAAAEVALGAPQPGVGMPSHRTGSVGGSNVMRAENKFSSDDHFFRVSLHCICPQSTAQVRDRQGMRMHAVLQE